MVQKSHPIDCISFLKIFALFFLKKILLLLANRIKVGVWLSLGGKESLLYEKIARLPTKINNDLL